MVTSETVRVNGLRFRCRLDGPEAAPWLVFSNSLLTDLTLWDDQVAAFGDRYRILRYDQRGHGGTEVPPNPTNLDELAGDAAALMRHFGASDAVFAGVSMGAATALLLATREPGLVAAVVASDGQAGTAPGGAAMWRERMDFAAAHGMDAVAKATLARWFTPKSRESDHPSMGRLQAMIAATPLQGFVACATALQNYEFRAALPTLRQPVLLLAGAQDGAMPTTMRALAGMIPDSRFVEIPDAGHLPGIEAPEAFNAAMAAFLGERASPH
ncbi:alpha/beta fold hydrolase [Roseomonas marmotae]|uniref:Alpha/beta fold hydrolase n=1 Tax=Roseomonas marmotae TaxID=2768161 RepID=A0ABS3KHC7_9PROT|nr:alpha/beta fold hydrolase [Roseomonas marmotae]MBO1076845.1 alpha/beta fold hydrolase [Roseomonas marmotae]QTI81183.1 alpha/beta fold hydrolase [Roseomonas marmotae]